MISFDLLLFIVWIICGILNIIGGLHDDEKKVPVFSYVLVWVVLLLELFSKIMLTGGFNF